MMKWNPIRFLDYKVQHSFQLSQVRLAPEWADQGKGENLYEPTFLLVNNSIVDGRIQKTLASNEDDIRLTRFPRVVIDYVQLQDEVSSELTAKISRIVYFSVAWAVFIFVFSAILPLFQMDDIGYSWESIAWGSFIASCLILQEKFVMRSMCKKRISTHLIEQTYLRFGQDASESNS